MGKTVRLVATVPEYGIVMDDLITGVMVDGSDRGLATMIEAGDVPDAGIEIEVALPVP